MRQPIRSLFIPLVARQTRGFRLGIPFSTNRSGPNDSEVIAERAAATVPRRAQVVCNRDPTLWWSLWEFRPYAHGGRRRGRTRHAHLNRLKREGVWFEIFRQFIPHRPRRSSNSERFSGPERMSHHEDARPRAATCPPSLVHSGRRVTRRVLLRRRPQLHQPVLLHVCHGVAAARLAKTCRFDRPTAKWGTTTR